MTLLLVVLVAVAGCAWAAPSEAVEREKPVVPREINQQNEDLLTEASNAYGRSYSDWGGYPSAGYNGYGVTGYGTIDDKYNNYNSYYGGYGGYDNANGYSGYAGNPGYAGGAGYGGYNDYSGYKRYGGYGQSSVAGNGGYGGYGGNGGLISYYGYNSPYNQGSYHLGYGYYNKRPGNIYNSGVTPNLVTGYRGYSRR